MNYHVNNPYPSEEQYDSTEWKLKRKTILERDNLECRKCANTTLIGNSIIGKIVKVDDHLTLLGLLNMSDERFYKNGYQIVFLDDLGKEYTQNILSHYKIDDFEQYVGNKIYLCTIRDVSNGKGFLHDAVNLRTTDTIINGIENPISNSAKDKWFYVRNLHVHHLSYPNDDDIANVSDKELITLCANCHQKEHPNQKLIGFCD